MSYHEKIKNKKILERFIKHILKLSFYFYGLLYVIISIYNFLNTLFLKYNPYLYICPGLKTAKIRAGWGHRWEGFCPPLLLTELFYSCLLPNAALRDPNPF